MRKLILSLIFLAGCAPNSSGDFHREGQARCRRLAGDLKKIETRDQLQKALPQLQKRFEDLVDLMIEARRFQTSHPEVEIADDPLGSANEDLIEEFKRIYHLEGGRDLIEKAQREALIRLDAFERSLAKQKEVLPGK